MSTTSKGNAFEQRVYEALAEELKNDRLCASQKRAMLHRRKSYYSRDRNSGITTDISLEVFLPERAYPTFVWIFECKDYSGRIPVDDIEEFHSKLQQIGEDNTKGTIVTNGALQKSALAYAKSKRIGVIRLLPDDQLTHVMEFITMQSLQRALQIDWSEFARALTDPDHRSVREFFGTSDDHHFGNWYSMLAHELLLNGI